MNTVHSSHETSTDLSKKQIAAIVAGTVVVAGVAAYGVEQYVANNMEPGQNISNDLGITHNSEAFHQDLENGAVAINVPAIDVMHSHGDK